MLGFILGFQFRNTKSADEYFRLQTRDENAYPKKRIIAVAAPAPKPKVNVDPEKAEVKQAIEDERTRIKLLLHDDTVQRLMAIRLRMDGLVFGDAQSLRQKTDLLRDDLGRTIRSLRFIITNIMDEEYEDTTISELLQKIKNRFDGFLLMQIKLTESGSEHTFELTPKEKHEIMLIVQEALQNTIKHANSQQFNININWQPARLIIETEDDLWALDPGRVAGLGTSSMKTRAESIRAGFFYRFILSRGMVMHLSLTKSQHAIAQQKTH